MNRRDFIETSLTLGAALATGGLRATEPIQSLDTNLKILILATKWGNTEPIEDFCRTIKGQGYDGLEMWYTGNREERERLIHAAGENGLVLGVCAAGSGADFDRHEREFRAGLEGALAMAPLYVNTHSGRDIFTVEQNLRLVKMTLEVSKASGVPIHHETHRSRMCYSAPVARNLLEQVPDMTLTLDISHWCNVHESLLEDQAETVELALQRTRHIHARVGHSQGPQVNDPRAPEWKSTVDRHLAWWDRVVELRRKAGASSLTLLTEFGAPNYMPTLPHTREPVANLAEVNLHMLRLLRQRYQA